MSEERNYPVTILQQALQRHLDDAQAAGHGWLVDVVALLIKEAALVPAPETRTETLPDYIYPH